MFQSKNDKQFTTACIMFASACVFEHCSFAGSELLGYAPAETLGTGTFLDSRYEACY